MTYTLKKVFDKRTFCWNAVQMLHRLVLIHGTACNADSQHSESQFECVWDVFTGHIGAAVRPQRNVLVLVWWCKTVINVCSLSLLLSSPIFAPTLSPNCLLYSLPLNNPPPLPSLALPPSIFPHLPLFHILYPTCLLFYFPLSLALSLCPTGVRAGDDISILQVHPHHHGKSSPMLPHPLLGLLWLRVHSFLPPTLSLY